MGAGPKGLGAGMETLPLLPAHAEHTHAHAQRHTRAYMPSCIRAPTHTQTTQFDVRLTARDTGVITHTPRFTLITIPRKLHACFYICPLTHDP